MATAKFYLDTRKGAGVDRPATLKIAVNHRSGTAFLVLNVQILSSQWDKKQQLIIDHPQKKVLNLAILQKLQEVESAITVITATQDIDCMTATQLVNEVKERLNIDKPKREPKKPKENPNTVGKYFIRYKENKGLRPRTAEMYDVTWRRIEAWLGKEAAEKLEFTDINFTWIEDFDKFLSTTAPSANGRRLHHANLKAVIGYAIDHEVLDRNPYRRYKIKTETTKKRNMSVEALRMIIFAQDLEPWMEKYRDFFVLSFMLRGLNTVDLCHLTKAVDGRVDWVRTKTSQPLSLKIEPEMQMIIDM